jgi:hypothetical protein
LQNGVKGLEVAGDAVDEIQDARVDLLTKTTYVRRQRIYASDRGELRGEGVETARREPDGLGCYTATAAW